MASLLMTPMGCGPSTPAGPETVPVSGKIEFVKGGDIAKLHDREGAIEFESSDSPGQRAIGAINQDGSFTMTSMVANAGKEGVVPGKHRVRLNLDDDTKALVNPKFLSFETSGLVVTLPSNELILIKIWK
jgi:hypothetical protein